MANILKIIFGALLISPLFQISYPYVSDWNIFYAAATNTLTPEMGGFHNPFWTIWLLKPLVVFGSLWGYNIMMGMVVSSTMLISKSVSGKYLPGAMAIISIPFLRLMIHGSTIELFPLWGVFSSSIIIAPLLLFIKPQTALFALAGRVNTNFLIIGISAIIGVITLLSIEFGNINTINQNISIFPYGIIIGLPLLIKSLRNGDVLAGAVATPLVAPYLITQSAFVPLFCAYLRWPKLSFILWVSVWVILLYFSR